MSQSIKAELLHLFKKNDSYAISELMAKLPVSVSQKTVQRTLKELLDAKKITKTGQLRSTRYQLIDPIEHNVHPFFSESSLIWIEKSRASLFHRKPVTYHDDWVKSYIANKTFYLPENARRQLAHLGKRSFSEIPAGTYAKEIFNRLLINLSYNSSRLEGNTYSLLETEHLLLEGTSAEGKLDLDRIMILNHKEAIRFLVEQASRLEINIETIYTLHYLLSDQLLSTDESGKIRIGGVRISATTYVPLEGKERLLSRLQYILDTAHAIQDPYEQSFFLLVHIAYLQPFSDVNKRTARLAANIPLIKNNLAPLSFNDIDTSDYISSVIAAYEFNNLGPLQELYCWSYERSCLLFDVTAESLGVDLLKVKYRTKRRELIREIIHQNLNQNEVLHWIDNYNQEVPLEHRKKLTKDLLEELADLEWFKANGLGVSKEEFDRWIKYSGKIS